MPQMMFVDSEVLREKVESKQLRIQYLEGLIYINEEKCEKFPRSKAIYQGIINQYWQEIVGLKSDIERLEGQIRSVGGRK